MNNIFNKSARRLVRGLASSRQLKAATQSSDAAAGGDPIPKSASPRHRVLSAEYSVSIISYDLWPSKAALAGGFLWKIRTTPGPCVKLSKNLMFDEVTNTKTQLGSPKQRAT